MRKSQDTLTTLQSALQRLIEGQPKRVLRSRKLSIRAVEEEANLGNGSAYYYPAIIEQIRQAKQANNAVVAPCHHSDLQRLREKLKRESRLKTQYRQEMSQLKEQIAILAGEHHHFHEAHRKVMLQLEELALENQHLKEQAIHLKRSTISPIKS
ncbi:hypothetical protein F0223_23315 [Vibrio coralliilyticus]|uniref:hypothetical protein n=1 Tax=Vibrio TaxID=662 RepID=UPI000501AD2B|nr:MULTISPECIES: hypothetical protein [Vibrio]KFI09470.1 hypothetical protein IX95_24015 [Vibrio sp. B183]NOI21136.1 hypothetical protein [Vibrio coralliilyticus]